MCVTRRIFIGDAPSGTQKVKKKKKKKSSSSSSSILVAGYCVCRVFRTIYNTVVCVEE